VSWRERVAHEKVARFADEDYWGRPVPGFGDPGARILILGLAPAAHGGNRTGRIFTGDRSGDFLFASLHRCGLANQATSIARDDGLALSNAYVTAVNRCAPPGNKPTPEERDRCLPFLARELMALERLRTIVALGAYAWDGALRAIGQTGATIPSPRPRFGHAAEAAVGPYVLVGCFHPSQQNTFTGKLTADMLDAVLHRAIAVAS
jgi:uracil-DNA glycosylase family 4